MIPKSKIYFTKQDPLPFHIQLTPPLLEYIILLPLSAQMTLLELRSEDRNLSFLMLF